MERPAGLDGVEIVNPDPLQVGFFTRLLLLQQQKSKRSYKLEVAGATIVFFFCFSVIALFSPSIAVLAPLNNFTVRQSAELLWILSFSLSFLSQTTQSSVLIALPTVTSTIVRIPLSISTLRFGVIAPMFYSQSVALSGLLALFLTIFFATPSPDLFGAYCVLALVVGVAGSVFPLCFLQVCCSRSRKSNQP